jgi:hypothetical protein
MVPKDGQRWVVRIFRRNSSLSPPFVIQFWTGFGRDLNETADFDLAAKMVQTTGLDL